MYDIFRSSFSSDYHMVNENVTNLDVTRDNHGLAELMLEFGGYSFDKGLYRVMTPDSIEHWNQTIEFAFPDFDRRIQCFGYDWLGRIFALDSGRLEEGRAGVVMFEPGTGQALEIPCNIVTFHNEELVDYREEALAVSFRHLWLVGGVAPGCDECIGYRIPLFLGGKDIADNLEITNLDVYWTLAGQMIRRARRVPQGTPLGKITSDDGSALGN